MAAEHTQAEAIPVQRAAIAADQDQPWPARERWLGWGFDHMPCGMVVMSLAPGRPNLCLAAHMLAFALENADTSGSDGIAHLAISRRDANELAVLLPGRYVLLRITDTGTGMDSAIADRAFEPFFSTKDGSSSAGLGLTAVRGFAAQAGGRAWLQSERGQGITVTVALPAAPGSGYGPASAGTGRAASAPAAGSVLVIDDNPQIREVVHRVLSSKPFSRAALLATVSRLLGASRPGGDGQ
jgi:hypothetical protein